MTRRVGFLAAAAASAALCPSAAHAAEASLDGAALGVVWVLPFAGLLLSIALFPLAAPRFWHRHDGTVAALWSALVVVPLCLAFDFGTALREVLHIALLDYVPFVILLTALFVITGGIRVSGNFTGTPAANVGLLGAGTLLAGWMGTTGASMLLIRTVIQANRARRYNTHVLVFFIFLVSNIGGALSPLGDPPLFLGFLRGVEFFWPTVHLLPPTMLTAGILLCLFFLLDSFLYRREAAVPCDASAAAFRVEGGLNFVLLTGVIIAVMLSGGYDLGTAFEIHGIAIAWQSLLRDTALVGLLLASLFLADRRARERNHFSWGPMVEVAKIFAGIFITIIPPLAMLRAGHDGALAGVLGWLHVDGQPVDAAFFWMTGALSSFLDNAPTYVVFFNAAGGDPHHLMGPLATTLMAISAGAVYMGAITYIGNAPNFMVKAIAETHAIRMPSFFGYMAWSLAILVPVFALVTLVFFR
jgi:Na+/H+ antiporter NhaD/arsenite permease-like protein